MTPIAAFDHGFMTQETADTFPTLICRDSRYGQTGVTAYSISFLFGFIKDLGFRRINLKCDYEPSTKALQDVVIHACVGVEVIPQGPLGGDHMANGRVEMAVREVKRQCRTLRISAEQNTCVRIADDSSLLSWLPRFAAQVMNKMRSGKDGKTSDVRITGRRWRKPMAQFGGKVWFRKNGEDGMIEQEQFCALSRMELCDAKSMTRGSAPLHRHPPPTSTPLHPTKTTPSTRSLQITKLFWSCSKKSRSKPTCQRQRHQRQWMRTPSLS